MGRESELSMKNNILEIKNLSVYIDSDERKFSAVDNISFCIAEGEIFGIVGESGCGKTLTALSVQELLSEGVEQSDNAVLFENRLIHNLSYKEKLDIYGKDISIIFQEPMTALNPLLKIKKQVEENLILHTNLNKTERYKRVEKCLREVGINNAEQVMEMYPHELSGGMRQRVMIASAVICRPKLLIADEPTTALDVTTQNQVLELIKNINAQYGTAVLFISHDLKAVSCLCNRVAVMYAGKIIEEGSASEIFQNPRHEYTKGLLKAIPSAQKKGKKLDCIPGKVPSANEAKMSCAFAPRCSRAEKKCYINIPDKKQLSATHYSFCHFASEQEI